MEGPTDKLNIDAPSGANVGPLFGHLASNKIGIVKNDFADMPRIMIGPHPGKGCPFPLRISQNRGC